MIYRLEIGNQSHKIEISKDKRGTLKEIFVDDQKFIASDLNFIKGINFNINNDSINVSTSKETFEFKLTNINNSNTSQTENANHVDQMREFFKEGKLVSPLPGKIVDIRCKEGSIIETGKILIALEAMKMENEIHTQYKIEIKKILVNISDSVIDKQMILEYEIIEEE